MSKTAICLVVKNEDAIILEWIAFHALIGFDSFLILDDHSTDRTAGLARRAGAHLDVRVMPWSEQGPGEQGAGYHKICQQFSGEFSWIAFIDSDEFLLPAAGESLADLLARNETSAAIAIPWRIFGAAGHVIKPAGLVIENFQYCAPLTFKPNHHVKSIIRPGRVIAGNNPHHFEIDRIYALPDGTAAIWGDAPGILKDYPARPAWQVNHYFTRSKQHWVERMKRGQLGAFIRTMDEFHAYDRNEIYHPAALSEAERIYLPICGIYNPVQLPGRLFLPLDEPGYEYTLFPFSKAAGIRSHPVQFALSQDLLARQARPVLVPELRDICRRAAALLPPLPLLSGFDPDFYQRRYADIAAALQNGLPSALHHYLHAGFHEGRQPLEIDPVFYANLYPDAAMEIAQGFYANPLHHYIAAGRAKGYLPKP